jgi:hypothetical protein
MFKKIPQMMIDYTVFLELYQYEQTSVLTVSCPGLCAERRFADLS